MDPLHGRRPLQQVTFSQQPPAAQNGVFGRRSLKAAAAAAAAAAADRTARVGEKLRHS
jgi:hypothetical protein